MVTTQGSNLNYLQIQKKKSTHISELVQGRKSYGHVIAEAEFFDCKPRSVQDLNQHPSDQEAVDSGSYPSISEANIAT